MSTVQTGYCDPIAMELIKLLGCPKNVRRIEYRASVGEVSSVTVEYLPEIAGRADALAPIVRRFRLEQVGDAEAPRIDLANHASRNSRTG